MTSWSYTVASVQDSRVTWINGEWNGQVAVSSGADDQAKMDSCPLVWQWLQTVGAQGWELVSVVQKPAQASMFQTLYLRRPS